MLKILIDTYLLCLMDMFFNTQHSYWYQLCSFSHRLVPLFVRGRLHTGASQENKKKLALSFNFTFHYIDDVLSMNNFKFGDFVDRIYPVELEIFQRL